MMKANINVFERGANNRRYYCIKMRNPGSLVLDIVGIHRIWRNLGFRICIRPCSFRFLALYPQPPLHIHRSQRNLSESILAFQTVRPRMRSFGSVLAVFFAVLVISTASSAVVADDTEDYILYNVPVSVERATTPTSKARRSPLPMLTATYTGPRPTTRGTSSCHARPWITP